MSSALRPPPESDLTRFYALFPQPALARDLRGKRLGCWCVPLPCHAEVIAEIADAASPPC